LSKAYKKLINIYKGRELTLVNLRFSPGIFLVVIFIFGEEDEPFKVSVLINN